MPLTPVAVALGSNLGDRTAHLAFAVERLGQLLAGVRVSRFVETAAAEVPGPQPAYLNAALTGLTTLAPRALLDELLAIEQARGRERPHRHAARTLDLDLVLYGDRVVRETGLEVPHPRFRDRRFVLAPLAEIAGEWLDPVTGMTISALLRALPARSS